MSAEPAVLDAPDAPPTPAPAPAPAPTPEPRPYIVDLAACLPLVARGERVVILGPDGKPAAALVSLDFVLEHAQMREDIEDGLAVDAALAEQAASGEEPQPLETVLAKYGL